MLLIARILISLLVLGVFSFHVAADDDVDITPLRLSYINGTVSFWRNGAEDWAEARINTPLARGDALYAGDNSELELQADDQSFIRADDNTQLSIIDQQEDFLQLKVPAGRVSLDLRSLPADNYAIELDTPNSVVTIARPGYYRLEVANDVHIITRRGGQATVIPAGGTAVNMQALEEVVVKGAEQGTEVAIAEVRQAPESDAWDRWNYDRTADLADAASRRYLPPGVAGASDLDRYGNWRDSDEYGPVWEPDAVPAGWVPYSTGRWIWDPAYQWTWIDNAPWGWAPFHYGRWICRDQHWMWAPGGVRHQRPAYAPALVGFYGPPPVRSGISASVGGHLGWVALSWGEPVVPWWGRPGFIGRPWWGGWHGPRVINNTVVKQTNITQIRQINFANSRIANAVVSAPVDRFGKTPVQKAQSVQSRGDFRHRQWRQVQGQLPVQPNPVSVVGGAPKSIRPPDQILSRPVMAVRRPPETRQPWRIDNTVQPRQVEAAPAAPAAVIQSAPNDVRTVPSPSVTGNTNNSDEVIMSAPIRSNPSTVVPGHPGNQPRPWRGDNRPHQVVIQPPPVPAASTPNVRQLDVQQLPAPGAGNNATNDPVKQETTRPSAPTGPQPLKGDKKGDNRPHQVIITPPPVAPSPQTIVNPNPAPAIKQESVAPPAPAKPQPWKGDNRPHQVIITPPPVSASPPASAAPVTRPDVAPAARQESARPSAKPWKGDNRPHQVIITPPPVQKMDK